MSIKTIAVHLAGDADQRARIETAVRLAERLGAKLVGIRALHPAEMPDATAGRGASAAFLREIEEASRERARIDRASFEQACAGRAAAHEWAEEEGDVVEVLTRRSAVSDLIVVTRDETLEDLESACPLLVLPEGLPAATLGRRILVEWRAEAESGRVVHAVLPVLRRADQVYLAGDESGAAQAWLAEQGIRAETAPATGCDLVVADEPSDRSLPLLTERI